MKLRKLGLAALLLIAGVSMAQTPVPTNTVSAKLWCYAPIGGLEQWVPCPTSGSSGTITVSGQPYQFTSTGAEQHNIALTASTAPPSIPAGTLFMVMSFKGTANVNCTYDGSTAPTSTVGNQLAPSGQYIMIAGAAMVANTRCIQTAATTTGDFQYFR